MNSVYFLRRLTVPVIFFTFGFVSFPLLFKLYGLHTVPLSRDQAEVSSESLIHRKLYDPSADNKLNNPSTDHKLNNPSTDHKLNNPSTDHKLNNPSVESLSKDQRKENVSTPDESRSSWIDSQLLKTHLNIPYAEEIPNQTRVFKWTGSQWVRLANFCTWSDFSRCSMLKTNKGETPIFHHEPKNDYTSGLLEKFKVREQESVDAILHYLGNDFSITFVDVGSHVGSIALQMAKVGFRIVTADPLPENIGRLCKSVQTGNFVNNATVLFTPVSSDHKTVSFIRKWNIGETKVKKVSSWEQTHDTAAPSCKLPPSFSKTATLDDIMPFIKTHKVFLKIDVESHEYFVIKGGKDFFKQRFVVGIFMEWLHVKNTPEAEELITLLNELGFKAYSLDKESIALIDANYMDWPSDVIWKNVIQ